MTNYTQIIAIAPIPHLTSKMDPESKRKWKNLYRKTKRGFTTAGLVTVGVVGIADDILKSKLKARAYSVDTLALFGPFMQMAGLPLYLYRVTSITTRFGIGLIKFGGFIIKGEYTVANITCVPVDFLLFGEWVDPTENQTFCIIGNQTVNHVLSVTEQLLGDESSD